MSTSNKPPGLVSNVPKAKALRVFSLYRRGCRAVEICNLMFPEYRRETDTRKRRFICDLMQYYGLAINAEERGSRARMFSRPKKPPRGPRKHQSKWNMR